MEYAQLKPGRRFAPLHSLLYYSQRIVTYPALRRLVVGALSAAVRLRQGSGRELHAATPADEPPEDPPGTVDSSHGLWTGP